MSEYATLTSRNLDPAVCSHERRSMNDSHRCFDCPAEVPPTAEELAEALTWIEG